MGSHSSFLFAEPSFTEGLIRFIDLGNTLNDYNPSPEADDIASWMDWSAVGTAMKKASTAVNKEIRAK